jgi:hypothetical protein
MALSGACFDQQRGGDRKCSDDWPVHLRIEGANTDYVLQSAPVATRGIDADMDGEAGLLQALKGPHVIGERPIKRFGWSFQVRIVGREKDKHICCLIEKREVHISLLEVDTGISHAIGPSTGAIGA